MKIIASDFRKGFAKVRIESLDDLWYLSQVISKGDRISGKTLRKITSGGGKDERAQKVTRVPVFIELEAEKLEYTGDFLRVNGKIREGPEDVPRGSYHTFTVEENSIITIQKEEWLSYQRKRLDEAASAKGPTIILLVLDREEAIFALLRGYRYEILSEIKGKVAKKGFDEEGKGNFYAELVEQIREYMNRYNAINAIVASPAFWKEDLLKEVKDHELKRRFVLATCSSVSSNAINEVLLRPEVKEVLRKDIMAGEMAVVEDLLTAIAKNGACVYGIKETDAAAKMGAVQKLLITDGLIHRTRENNTYDQIEQIMKEADQTKSEVHIISSEHEGGKKLDGLGGIGGILRYKLSYQ